MNNVREVIEDMINTLEEIMTEEFAQCNYLTSNLSFKCRLMSHDEIVTELIVMELTTILPNSKNRQGGSAFIPITGRDLRGGLDRCECFQTMLKAAYSMKENFEKEFNLND